MAARYSCVISIGALLNQNGQSAGHLWNPHGSKSIWLVETSILCTNTTNGSEQWEIYRTTTRGSASTTETPDIDNHHDYRFAPVSGALVDGVTTSPSFPAQAGPQLTKLGQTTLNVGPGHGQILSFAMGYIEIPAGTGVAYFFPAANTDNVGDDLEVSFTWDE